MVKDTKPAYDVVYDTKTREIGWAGNYMKFNNNRTQPCAEFKFGDWESDYNCEYDDKTGAFHNFHCTSCSNPFEVKGFPRHEETMTFSFKHDKRDDNGNLFLLWKNGFEAPEWNTLLEGSDSTFYCLGGGEEEAC
jgi:hypothetical protein